MKNIKALDERSFQVLLTEHEDIYLFDKVSNIEVWRTSMYGNATCGLISSLQQWVIIGGEFLITWFNN